MYGMLIYFGLVAISGCFRPIFVANRLTHSPWCSARVRQTTTTPSARGLATVGLVTSQGYLSLTNPDNVSQAWQWVAMTRDFPQPVELLSLELYVDGGGSGVAYFDNVCVSVTVLDPLRLIIGASVGGGLAFILCLALCFCLLLCLLSRCVCVCVCVCV